MLSVGDKIVYPMHGAGSIEAIEEHDVLGKRQTYYVLALPSGGMKLMIPMQQVTGVGLRVVIAESEIPRLVGVIQDEPDRTPQNWNKRLNVNMAKMKTGCVFQVAEVVRNLAAQEREKKLSTGERRLLETAKNILSSEVALSCGIEVEAAENWLIALLNAGEKDSL